MTDLLADTRGTGPAKRRKWEQAVNSYQKDLGKTYQDWANDTADELEAAEDPTEADDILDEALITLAAALTKLGRENIVAGAQTALGKTIPGPQFLSDLADRVEANDGYIEDSLVPDIRNKLFLALRDPDVVATGAVALLGALMAFGGRVESYAGGMWTAMQEAQGETAQQSGAAVAWQRDEQAKHCGDCTDFGEDEFPGKVYDSWEEMAMATGDRLPGEVECGANCRCTLWVEDENGDWTREGYAAPKPKVEQMIAKPAEERDLID